MYVTLNINTNNVRLVAVQGRVVKKWGEVPLPSGTVKDGRILQPEAVADAINNL